MSPQYPDKLHVALLFGPNCPMQTVKLDGPKLVAAFNTRGAGVAGIAQMEDLTQNKPRKFIAMGNDRFQVTITANANELDAGVYSRVMRSPFYAKMQPGLIEAAKVHENHIMIEVNSGTSEHGDTENDQNVFDVHLRLTKEITALVNEMSPGGTIYWGQSDQIYASAAFAAISERDFPLSLFIHPQFHASGATKNGQVLAGVRGLGSQHVLGKPVVFAEHTQPMVQSYERLLEFVDHCRSEGAVLQDGARFGGMNSTPIEIRHHPATTQFPTGYIELVVCSPDDLAGKSGSIKQDESSVLRNAFLGRTNAPENGSGSS
ncbi:MAG: hypothetical protein ABJR23_22465, partial [Paracoccaceae bacterium]